jgi:hypothetical protein
METGGRAQAQVINYCLFWFRITRDLHGSKTGLPGWNINDLPEAIESLLSITSADVSEIRMMDRLLEVWTGKVILFSPS